MMQVIPEDDVWCDGKPWETTDTLVGCEYEVAPNGDVVVFDDLDDRNTWLEMIYGSDVSDDECCCGHSHCHECGCSKERV